MSNNSDLPPRDPMTGRLLQVPPPAQFGATRPGQLSGGQIVNVESGATTGGNNSGGKIVHK